MNPVVASPAADLAGSVVARYRAHLGRGRAAFGELLGGDVEVSAQGPWVTTASGRQLLNCGGYGVFLMGARHPVVIAHVARQLQTHPVATRVLLEPTIADAAQALAAVTPPGLDRVYFGSSGADAVEAAIKLARAQGRRHLVSTRFGFHGKSMGALSVTANPLFQSPFRPLLPDVAHVPYGDAAALEAELAAHHGQACVIVEPVQGEAGVVVPPAGYLRDVERLCREHGALFVLDEVQTGLGRLGHWWGADREGVTPDVLLVGKGLSGGVVPVSAMVATAEAFHPFDRDPFIHTSTFSGAPLAMAAAQGAIAAIRQDDLVRRAAELGGRILPELDSIARTVLGHRVREVRGVGLLMGVELAVPGLAGDLLIELLEAGVLANHSMHTPTVLRLTPPAVLGDAEVLALLDAFERACRAVVS